MGVLVKTGGAPGTNPNSPFLLSGTDIIYDPIALAVTQLILGPATSNLAPLSQTLAPTSVTAGGIADTAGATLTIASGAGTGTGAVSTLIFQTPTVAVAGVGGQAMATRLTISSASILSTVPFVGPQGSLATPSFSFTGTTAGMFFSAATAGPVLLANGTQAFLANDPSAGSNAVVVRLGFSTLNTLPSAADVYLSRGGAAATLQLGAANAAAPVSQTLQAQGSRSGTDVDVGGGSLTIQPGAGTGAGTPSTLIFAAPVAVGAGSGAQTMATRLTISGTAITATVPVAWVSGSVSAPGLALSGAPSYGFYYASTIGVAFAGVAMATFDSTQGLTIKSTLPLCWGSTNVATPDLFLTRSAAATLQFGAANAAAPVSQTLQAQGSRSGTDVDIGGGNLTIQSGTGTGTGALSTLIFRAPVVAAGGTSNAQTMTTYLTIGSGGVTVNAGQLAIPAGTATNPGLLVGQALGTATQEGIYNSGNMIGITVQGVAVASFNNTTGIILSQTLPFSWGSAGIATPDLFLTRDGAAELTFGAAAVDTAPVSQTIGPQKALTAGTADVGGSNLTILSGVGKGTGAASSILFRTPTVAGGSSNALQTMATRLTISAAAITATVPFIAPAGTEAAPAFSFTGSTNSGFRLIGATIIGVTLGGANTTFLCFDGASSANGLGMGLTSGANIWWTSSATAPNAASGDLFLTRGGAATLQLGKAAADTTATDQILQVQGVLVGGTADQAGGKLTILSGQGKGTGAISTITFKTPSLGVAGTVLQSMVTRLTIDQNQVIVGNRLCTTMGANVNAANDLTLGVDGNVFTIAGNTQINAITTANWTAGSIITLIFSGTPTVKYNTAGGAGTALILLAGAVDFVASAEDVLQLVYNGTNWREIARAVI